MRNRSIFVVLTVLLLSICLSFSGCSTEQEIGAELIKNGSFSAEGDGAPDGWTVTGWDLSTSISYFEIVSDGGREDCVHLVNAYPNDFRLEQTVNVAPNSFYKLTCYVKTAGVTGGTAGANISLTDSLATSVGILGTTEWQQIQLIGKTASGQKHINVAIRLGGFGSEASGEAWFDDFSIVRINAEEAGTQYADFSYYTVSDTEDDGYVSDAVYGYVLAAALLTFTALAYALVRQISKPVELNDTSGDRRLKLVLILVIAFVFRVVCSLVFQGHTTDLGCFVGWANHAADVGISSFYETISFCDYPPGYMYVLWLVGSIGKLIGVNSGPFYYILIKLPSMLADLVVAYLLYRLVQSKFSQRAAVAALIVAAFCPAFMFISAGWGQIDQLLALCILLAMYMFIRGKVLPAGLLYGLAILMKPQALIFGPLFFVAYMLHIKDSDERNKFGITPIGYVVLAAAAVAAYLSIGEGASDAYVTIGIVLACVALAAFVADFVMSSGERRKTLLNVHGAVAGAVALVLLGTLPFKGGQEFLWFIDKYAGTATSYRYASIEAFNLFSLFGGNWAPVDTVFILGMSYETVGSVLIALSCVVTAVFYAYGRRTSDGCISLCGAYIIVAVFVLGHFMHERYLMPALALLLFASFIYNDRRLYWSFALFASTFLFNALFAFFVVAYPEWRTTIYNAMLRICSLVNVLGFAYLTYVCADITIRKRTSPILTKKDKQSLKLSAAEYDKNREETIADMSRAKRDMTVKVAPVYLPEPTDNKLRYSKRDYIFCISLTVLYAVVAILNLGSLKAPESYWIASGGDSFNIILEEETYISEVRIFGGIETTPSRTTSITVESDSGNMATYEFENGDMFRWTVMMSPAETCSNLTVTITGGEAWINEIALFDGDNQYIPYTVDNDEALAVCDEPEEVENVPSNLNGMYFDELYHARTAYEHANGLNPYENSHPPLGKVFISIGIAIFGMNAFGWRIIGTLFGIGMLPIMYAFAKRLFKKSEFALLATGLLALDFMHFTQTRIATIDVYSVFFVILMYYYMYQYYCMNFHVDGLKKTLKPLGLAGLFFGIGASCKWTGIYAGMGLAVILAISLVKRWIEYRNVMRDGSDAERAAVSGCWKKIILTLAWCCVFYIAVPVTIYLLSYIPYMLCESPRDIQGILDLQAYMFNYHSSLTDTHSFQSAWYSWPFTIRPIWYYNASHTASGMAGSISAFGNPAVWWLSTIGTVALGAGLLSKRVKSEKGMTIAFIGIAANLLPWVFVTRCTFIYHFFGTVPFIILCAVYLLKALEERLPSLAPVKWVWLAIALVLFAMFYPVLSGTPASVDYVNWLEWMPSWVFTNKV
ncbi:MAG: glycosyltransferase family 39 protein [Clostridia bacterium]|nr:glycosyltransferase family 39 protein [Clostridia bacterium]